MLGFAFLFPQGPPFFNGGFEALHGFLDGNGRAGQIETLKTAALFAEDIALVKIQPRFFLHKGFQLKMGHAPGAEIYPQKVCPFQRIDLYLGEVFGHK